MGDKEATFIGLNEWIGAFEISYIISNLRERLQNYSY